MRRYGTDAANINIDWLTRGDKKCIKDVLELIFPTSLISTQSIFVTQFILEKNTQSFFFFLYTKRLFSPLKDILNANPAINKKLLIN